MAVHRVGPQAPTEFLSLVSPSVELDLPPYWLTHVLRARHQMAGESPVWGRVGHGQAPAQLPTLLVLPVVLMQFMGDQPKPQGKDEIELLYELLKVSEGCVRWDLGGGHGEPEDEVLSCLGLYGTPFPCSLLI